MSYEVEYEKKEKKEKEPYKPHYEKSECGEIKIKTENVYININCKEEKDYNICCEVEYEKKEKKEKEKEPYKPHFEESECGEVKIYAQNVYININCKEKKDKREY